METLMRTLQIEELELVAGGVHCEKSPTDNSASKCNNGLGNGDQGAPGNSDQHNQAENTFDLHDTCHISGFEINYDDCGRVPPG